MLYRANDYTMPACIPIMRDDGFYYKHKSGGWCEDEMPDDTVALPVSNDIPVREEFIQRISENILGNRITIMQ